MEHKEMIFVKFTLSNIDPQRSPQIKQQLIVLELNLVTK